MRNKEKAIVFLKREMFDELLQCGISPDSQSYNEKFIKVTVSEEQLRDIMYKLPEGQSKELFQRVGENRFRWSSRNIWWT